MKNTRTSSSTARRRGINGVELGCGRGSTKAPAKQDASPKALSALVPGVVFDPNGILNQVVSVLGERESGNHLLSCPTTLTSDCRMKLSTSNDEGRRMGRSSSGENIRPWPRSVGRSVCPWPRLSVGSEIRLRHINVSACGSEYTPLASVVGRF